MFLTFFFKKLESREISFYMDNMGNVGFDKEEKRGLMHWI